MKAHLSRERRGGSRKAHFRSIGVRKEAGLEANLGARAEAGRGEEKTTSSFALRFPL